MVWILNSVGCALFYAFHGAYSKKLLKDGWNEYILLWFTFIGGIPFLIIPFLFVPFPQLNSTFWIVLFSGIGGNSLAFVLYFKAIKETELSISIPLVSITPLFMLLTSYLILSEVPDITGITGILLVITGCYTLGTFPNGYNFLQPFKNLWEDKGARYAILVALIWSVTANLDKVAVLNSSPFAYPLIFNIFFPIPFSALVLGKIKRHKEQFQLKAVLSLIFLGFLNAVMVISQMVAIELALASYVITIKRSGMVVSVLIGWLVFKEKRGFHHMLSASIILFGIMLVLLFH